MCTNIMKKTSKDCIKINLDNYNINSGSLILVNKNNQYNTEESELVKIDKLYFKIYGKKSIYINKRMNKSLLKLIDVIKGKREIVAVSGYRSKEEQKEIFDKSVKEKGIEFTKKYVARPGESEHQTGLAIDLGKVVENIDFICPSFPNEGICKKYNELAAKYGFIMRYKKDKEHITGISEEKWHFRFVGNPHAQVISNNNYCLEEYIDYLRKFEYEDRHLHLESEEEYIEIFFVSKDKKLREITLPNNTTWTVSGNNIDGLIFTVYKTKERNKCNEA